MNPYKVLGLKPDASPELIRMRHKQLAKRFHPDRNANPEAIAKFKEIQAAFDILNDPIRRKHFDDTGTTDRVTLDERRGRVLGLVVSVLYDLVVEMVRQGHDPLRHNLIKLLNDQFNDRVRQVKTSLALDLRVQAAIKPVSERFTRKQPDNGEAVEIGPGEMLLVQAKNLDKKIERTKIELKLQQDSLLYLNDYGFRSDLETVAISWGMFQGTHAVKGLSTRNDSTTS